MSEYSDNESFRFFNTGTTLCHNLFKILGCVYDKADI